MIEFILNDKHIRSTEPSGTTVLDIVRYHEGLPGTKIGCREGDCGACTVIVGELDGGKVVYRTMTSCLLALANVHGRHVVTIEGLELNSGSNFAQQAMLDESGTQCGFCTPGFIVSLTSCCLDRAPSTYEHAIRAIDGNICRCTGYKSIERAAARVTDLLAQKDLDRPIEWSVDQGHLPSYFNSIKARLQAMRSNGRATNNGMLKVGGGTDLYVQQHENLHETEIGSIFNEPSLKGILVKDGICTIGGAATASDLLNDANLRAMFPRLEKHLLLVSSTPIRNMGTIAGNFVNASPIGDLTAFFIALNSSITLKDTANNERTMALKDLYKGYKQIDLKKDEIIGSVSFKVPSATTYFNFEKVSKRTMLDIATVNTAMRLEINGTTIDDVHISAGGVAPTPLYLQRTCEHLRGAELSLTVVLDALSIMQQEISPISDVRGSAEYKRTLLRNLVYVHFTELWPERFAIASVTTA